MSAVQCRISYFFQHICCDLVTAPTGGVLYWLQDLQQIQASVGASAATLREGSTVNGHMDPRCSGVLFMRYSTSCGMCGRSHILVAHLHQP